MQILVITEIPHEALIAQRRAVPGCRGKNGGRVLGSFGTPPSAAPHLRGPRRGVAAFQVRPGLARSAVGRQDVEFYRSRGEVWSGPGRSFSGRSRWSGVFGRSCACDGAPGE